MDLKKEEVNYYEYDFKQVIQFSFEWDKLAGVLEWLARMIKQKDAQIGDLTETVNNLSAKVENIFNSVNQNERKFNDLCENLKERVIKLESNDPIQDDDIDWLKKQVKSLLEKPTFDPNSSDFDISQIVNLIDSKYNELDSKFTAKTDSLKDYLEGNFVQIPTFDAFKTKHEEKVKEIDAKFYKIDDALRSHKDYLVRLDEVKADKSDIDAIKKFINSALNNNNQGDVNFEGLDQLQDLLKRITKIEQTLVNFVTQTEKKAMENDLKELWRAVNQIRNDTLPKIDTRVGAAEHDIEALKSDIKRLDTYKMDKTKFDELMNYIRELQRKLKDLSDKVGNARDHSEDIKNLQDAIDSLKIQFGDLYDSTNISISGLKDELKGKASNLNLDDLRKWTEEELKNLKEDVDQKLDLKADKAWVKDMLKKYGREKTPAKGVEQEDAMFSRKPLLASLCASCDGDLKALKGVKADHVDWARMPTRQDSGRIASLGQGFSRMLLMMNEQGDQEDLYLQSGNLSRHEDSNKLSTKQPSNSTRPASRSSRPQSSKVFKK